MMLQNFKIRGGQGFSDNDLIVTRRCIHIAHALEFELSLRQAIEFPYPRIEISLWNSALVSIQKPVIQYGKELGNYVEARVPTTEYILSSSYKAFTQLVFGLVREGLSRIEQSLGWASPELDNIIKSIKTRDRIFHYHLFALSKTDKVNDLRAEVYYDMTDEESEISVMLYANSDNQFVRKISVRKHIPSILAGFFPVVSTRLESGQMLFYSSEDELIESISIA